MKRNFGIRFVLWTFMSFILGLLFVMLNVGHYQNVDYQLKSLVITSSQFTLSLIVLGYFHGLKTPLKTRLGQVSFLVYLVIKAALLLITVFLGFKVISLIGRMESIPSNILGWVILGPFMTAF